MIPDLRSGLVPIHTPSQSLRPAGAETAHGSLRLDSRALGCGACVVAVVVAAAPSSSLLLPRRHCCSLVVAALPSRVPWTFGIFGSPWMPFRRGRHLIRVNRPIGSPPRRTPGRICFSLLSGRIRARRAYLPRRTHPFVAFATLLQTPACIRPAGSMAGQRFWRRVFFNSVQVIRCAYAPAPG